MVITYNFQLFNLHHQQNLADVARTVITKLNKSSDKKFLNQAVSILQIERLYKTWFQY